MNFGYGRSSAAMIRSNSARLLSAPSRGLRRFSWPIEETCRFW